MPLTKLIRILVLLLGSACSLIYGCAFLKPITPPASDTAITDPSKADKTLDVLYRQFESWKGVPYRLGGLSKKGIDCSGFVYLTYLNHFDHKLPRNTYRQSKVGDYVNPKNLRAGDLIFFRLGYSLRHVGIYLENGLFMHASSSQGVMISSLKNEYWSRRYWKAARIKIDRP